MSKKKQFSTMLPPKNQISTKEQSGSADKTNLIRNSRINKNSILWLQEAYDTSRGETALWVAVITQAMMDALSHSKKSDAKYQKHEAMCWLTGNSKDFVDVCIAAGMNPDYVRMKAKKVLAAPTPWRAQAGKGKRYLERKEYRKARKLKEKESLSPAGSQSLVISMF